MIIHVLAKPNSKIDKAELVDDILHLKIKAKPVDGEANEYIIKYLSKILSVPQSSIHIRKGHSSKHKLIEAPISIDELKKINHA